MINQFSNTINSTNSDILLPKTQRRGIIIGAGQVGISCAYSMLIQNTLDEMIIVDNNQAKAEGEVMDLVHGLPFVAPAKIKAGAIADGKDADLVIITAGAKQKPGQTRLELVDQNVKIFKNLIPEIITHCPKAILLIVTNPVDIMTYIALQISGLPSNRVIGSGTVLDTARFRYLLAEKLNIDPHSLHAYIIGEHGDSEVPVWSKVNISGMHLFNDSLAAGKPIDTEYQEVFNNVKNAAYQIIQRKGATCYAIGLSVTEIVQAILHNQNRVLTVSSLINNFHGIQDICLSLPSVVNRQGVERILNLSLTNDEQQQLQKSAQVLQQVIHGITL
jgi:L-lactate dehydrogenase